ncbi:MAG: cation:proton antiporter [Candidatus Omnitrophota bacterium]
MEITNPVLMFSFIMFVLLVAPAFSKRLKMPAIAGLIISGIIVGPHGLGILRPEGSIQLFSSVGLIYIMFLAGLEINAHEFSRQKKFSLVFGSLTFGIPMLLGTFGARAILNLSWPASILLASMFASHTLISFPIAANLGISRERSVVVTVGGTIITDTAAILVLAFIAEYVTASLTTLFWARQIFLLFVLIWFALWVLPRVARFFLRVLAAEGQAEFILILALVFLTAYLAHLAKVEPIIGAFLAGLSLSRMISEQSPLMSRLEFFGNAFFIPFFLISVGMLVNLKGLFIGGEIWAVAIFMVACAIFCKYAASMLFARIMKFSSDEGHLIFGLSVNQAAATLAAVIVGMRLGIFNEPILNGTIAMILVTCMLGPVFTEKYGKKVALQYIKPPSHLQHGDERIMVGVSRNKSVDFLTDVALKLRPKKSAEPLFPLYVIQDGEDLDKRISAGEKILSRIVTQAVSANVPVSPISRIDVNIPEGILHALREWRVDTLVIGASRHESNWERMLFGVHDKISGESRQMLFLCWMTHSLNIDKNIFFILPPISELEPGFNRAFAAVKDLAAANKLRLQIVATQQTIAHIKTVFNLKAEAGEMSFAPLSQWKEFSDYFKTAALKESDAVVLMTARKGKLGWRPSFEKMYYDLCREHSQNNILLVHPPDFPDSEESRKDIDLHEPDHLAGNIRNHPLLAKAAVDIYEPSPEPAVKALLESYFGPKSEKVPGLMKEFMPLDPLELTPEILLFHAHSYEIKEPLILLGINQVDFYFPPFPKKIRAFFVLISPRDQSISHLQALAKAARVAQEFQRSNARAADPS